MKKDQYPAIEWRDGVPIARQFDDPYFSLQDGLAEARHVFLAGNDLPQRFRDGFQIAELGFGTGLNAFATIAEWHRSGVAGKLHFTSFERFPMNPRDMFVALENFPSIACFAEPFLGALKKGETSVATKDYHLEVILGDVRQTLPTWRSRANAWYLDGFSPAKNPEMWDASLLAEVANHTAPGGTFATYSAAGFVRRALEQAGFFVERRPGFGRKRHMSVGKLPG